MEWVSKYYRGADMSLARPTSRCILFDGFIYIYIYIYIYCIYRALIFLQLWFEIGYMKLKILCLCSFFLPGWAKDLSALLYMERSLQVDWPYKSHLQLYSSLLFSCVWQRHLLVLWLTTSASVLPLACEWWIHGMLLVCRLVLIL